MKPTYPTLNTLAIVVALSLAGPASVWAQRQASPRSQGGGQRSGGGSDGGGGRTAAPAPQGAREPSGRSSGSDRGEQSPPAGTQSGRAASTGSNDSSDSGAIAGARSRDDNRAIGRAAPRQSGPSHGHGNTIIVGGYDPFYPWGYAAGLGLGYGYGYGGFGFGYGGWDSSYDPWFGAGYGYPVYGYPGVYAPASAADGGLRIKVSPSDATVSVDGYYAGQVDDFDNPFQKLRLDPGPHRIEIRKEGYDPLSFDIRVLPDRTTTYTGELKKL